MGRTFNSMAEHTRAWLKPEDFEATLKEWPATRRTEISEYASQAYGWHAFSASPSSTYSPPEQVSVGPCFDNATCTRPLILLQKECVQSTHLLSASSKSARDIFACKNAESIRTVADKLLEEAWSVCLDDNAVGSNYATERETFLAQNRHRFWMAACAELWRTARDDERRQCEIEATEAQEVSG